MSEFGESLSTETVHLLDMPSTEGFVWGFKAFKGVRSARGPKEVTHG